MVNRDDLGNICKYVTNGEMTPVIMRSIITFMDRDEVSNRMFDLMVEYAMGAPGRINKTKMNTNEFLAKVLPRTTMSKEEMAKAVSDASEDSLFRDAEKCFRSMGDGICGMLSSEEVSEIASRLF